VFAVGAVLYAVAHGWLSWLRRRRLAVEILKDSRFENWKRIALIAALHVQVENKADTPIEVTGYAYAVNGAPQWGTRLTSEERTSVDSEISRRDETQQYGQPLRFFRRIAAGQIISGWYLIPVNLPTVGGTPAVTVIVRDDAGNQYRATLRARKSRVYGS
jgi:hypothetical protein